MRQNRFRDFVRIVRAEIEAKQEMNNGKEKSSPLIA
jgi:hypothetical protein